MTLGALLDLGASEKKLREGLSLLRLPRSFELKLWKEPRHSIVGTRVAVLVNGHDADELADKQAQAAREAQAHSHDHSHDHGHSHDHHHSHADASHNHLDHNPFKKIRAQILESALPENVKEITLQIFHKIAVAEGKIHNQSPEEVEFHEVGAIDSIADIVGCAILIDDLAPKSISASPLPMGHGFIRCRHGRMPVPAPATLEILKGVPVYDAQMRGELVTPTGAAIIATLATSFARFIDGTPTQIGYGIGKNNFADRPNALRVILAEK